MDAKAWVVLICLLIIIVIVAIDDPPDKWGEQFEEDKGEKNES